MKYLSILSISILLFSCSSMPEYNPPRAYQNIEKDLLAQFMLAKDSSVIELPEGQFLFSKSLIMDGKHGITIRGKGKDKTVLSFKGQSDGAEGIRIANCSNIILEDFSIEDADGDNIKVTDTQGITIQRVKSAWTGIVNEENGAYGLYPVLSTHVVVKECEVLGASDAGIYVGQSDSVQIIDNKVYWNVAGIESENCGNVIISGNEAYENTGGILVFDLPGLTRYGNNVKAFDNNVYENNLSNFAPEGNMVAVVPPGTGFLILATQDVEVYQNQITNNKTIGVGIISYTILEALGGDENTGGGGSAEELESKRSEDTRYNPYVGDVYLHDNSYANSYTLPDLGTDFGKLFVSKFGTDLPDVVWDGIESPDFYLNDGSINPDYRICVSEAADVKTVNLDAANDFENLEVSPELFNCN